MSQAVRPKPRGFLSSQTTIMAIFFFQAVASSSMYTRIPDIQHALKMDEAALGLALIGQPVGALLMQLVSSVIIEKFGTRLVIAVCVPALAISVLLLSLAPTALTATLCFVLFGASFALSAVASNVEADRVEAATGSVVMNRCHGVWSVGFLISTLGGVAARATELSVFWHFLITLPITLLATLLIIWPMTSSPEREHNSEKTKKIKFALPTLATILLVGFGISAVLLESGTRSWAIIYMRDSFNSADWVDSLTLPAFFLTMAFGRIFSDKWIEKMGPRAVARITLLIGITGLSAIILAQNLTMALVGFGLLGLGISVIYPLMVSSGAQLGDRPASQNVASITMATSLAMLAAPALMGFVATEYGIRMSFAMLLPLLILSLFLTRLLKS